MGRISLLIGRFVELITLFVTLEPPHGPADHYFTALLDYADAADLHRPPSALGGLVVL